ncbi:MAG: class I poly(R)-hydroxyalkanoic acid synthase [Burkholderiales bacterium]|nr:Poly(3-hydroxyalkanoate) polymerase subunit PhaC [Rhodocyclaceae bacterium]MCQ3924189.1 class I poly(R)-hydroxyalkanoic acid synthase [Rhodocyclaceae bacterium]MCZ2421311.1 class I poly(R)-hydroxyalkanoic acid synthase [Burkholderiales bacterium]HNQ57340.1 class I poly(R)-hydroxyalkanoic acid synthase [Candidatus Desulfobacillus denitrificans]HNT61275.1 class I poly(R)-hydroxyalkanoic acid synthase [Candidatus Desulfobacillus denitrificans]
MSEQPSHPPALPDPKEIARIYGEVASRASKLIAEHAQRQMKHGIAAPSDELGIAQAFMDMMAKLLANPYKLAQAQMNLVWDYFSLWQHAMLRFAGMETPPVAVPKKGDNRFKDEQWEEHFLFDFIKQSYLITARHINDAMAGVDGLPPETAKKAHFFLRKFIYALSPSNFALTNPEVFRETVKSHGQNLLKGFNNLLRDIEEGDGQLRVKMTDPSAFELGRNVAVTPGKVVFQNELIQLLQFNPTTEQQYRRPLLIIPPWINKYYILDLRQSNSFIKYATDQGHTVFVISWVNPDKRLAEKDFEDYLSGGSLAALDAVCRQTGENEVNLIGYCLGGTLLGATLGYNAVKKDKRIVSATFFVSLLDFSIPGELGVFIDEQQVASLEKKMAERGYLEGSEMATTFNMLRSNDLIWSFVVNNYLMGREPMPFDLLFWNSDATRMPYKMHSFYLRNMYMKNLLREPGGIELNGVPIDLAKAKVPAYFISTVEDHIAPWKGTYLGATRLSGPVRFVLGGSGHIAGIVNPPAANKYHFWTNEAKTLPATPEEWFDGATQHPGSWWADWQQWIGGLNGDDRVPARDPAKGKLKAIEDAPGSFVKFRLDLQKKN